MLKEYLLNMETVPHIFIIVYFQGIQSRMLYEVQDAKLREYHLNMDTEPHIFIIVYFQGIQSRRPYEVQDAMLRRYLLELTQSFMFSLERYVTSLMPLQRNISPWKVMLHISYFMRQHLTAMNMFVL